MRAVREKIAATAEQSNGYSSEYEWDEFFAEQQKYKASWWRQFKALMWRSALSASREPMIIYVRASNLLVK